MIELITWITDPKKLPDADETVLVAVHDEACGEGFYDGECWRWASASQIPSGGVKAWATMPEGPKVKPAKKRKGRAHG
jgi:hypothetical protein